MKELDMLRICVCLEIKTFQTWVMLFYFLLLFFFLLKASVMKTLEQDLLFEIIT